MLKNPWMINDKLIANTRIVPKVLGRIALLFGCFASASYGQEGSPWDSLAIYPPEIHLSTTADLQHVIVVATRKDGITQDVTAEAEYALGNTTLASWSEHTLRPLVDGTTELKATWQGMSSQSPVVVTEATKQQNNNAIRPSTFGTIRVFAILG